MKLTEGRKIGDKGVPRALTPEEARKAAYLRLFLYVEGLSYSLWSLLRFGNYAAVSVRRTFDFSPLVGARRVCRDRSKMQFFCRD
jgi:hypothetical protein